MSEHPILFTGEMVRAILEGRKTQTRRVNVGRYLKWKKGDTLWVRERFHFSRPLTGDIDHDLTTVNVLYYATDNPRYRDKDKWKPSIHMPHWASRITLELTEDVRVERVQEITFDDCLEEGVIWTSAWSSCKAETVMPEDVTIESMDDGRRKFTIKVYHDFWDSINAKRGYSWASNPEVAVITFKRIDGNETAIAEEEK
jgi:hypothetical protein